MLYILLLKKIWRPILTNFKMTHHRAGPVPKNQFPGLLNELYEKLDFENKQKNMVKGFETTGIYPVNRDKILKKLPDAQSIGQNEEQQHVSNAVMQHLRENWLSNNLIAKKENEWL